MAFKHILFTSLVYVALHFSSFIFSQNNHIDYLNELKNRQDFDVLKGKPLSDNYNGIECIKLVYVISTKTLYYLESTKYRWHYRFTSEILNDQDALQVFNKLNYGKNPGRKYILATFNYNTDTKNYFLQFAPPDDISDELITTLVDKIAETWYQKTKFKILLNTTTLLRRKKELSKQHTIITSDELYKSQKYQAICTGKSTGILTFINADSIKETVDYSNCILVINGTSNQIPVCRGIITNQFQTPLSHICLLTLNRKTPCAYQKGSFQNDSLKKFENRYVELFVTSIKARVKSIAASEYKTTVRKAIHLSHDTSTTTIADLHDLSIKQRTSYGSKTCHLAELKKLEKQHSTFITPTNAFAIPFYYYYQHIKTKNIDILITNLQHERSVLKNDSVLAIRLKEIRQAITKASMDTFLLNHVTRLCIQRFYNQKVRFRSSSNCEDGASFNGAGLYTSTSGIANDSVKSYEKAIKKVWASLWSVRAYKEREYFNIDQNRVLMGILIHTAFDNEIVNGVAITKNLYRDYDIGCVINIQKGEEEVVSPKKDIVSEQVISYMNSGFDFYNTKRSADWISYSSLNPDGSLLSTEELFQLSQSLESIKRYFYNLYRLSSKTDYKKFAMDIEFKLIETADKKRKFIIKQARPYNH